MTLVQLLGWLRWVDDAVDDRDRESRARRVRKHAFNPKLPAAELARREKMLQEIRDSADDATWSVVAAEPPPDGEDAPKREPEPPTKAEPAPPRWEGLISPSSPVYRRGMLHDGTYDETNRMRDLARGSPFGADFDANPPREAPRKKPRVAFDDEDDDLPRRPR